MEAETGRFQHGPATALWGGAGQVRVFAHLCAGLLLGEFVLLLSLSLSAFLSLCLARSFSHAQRPTGGHAAPMPTKKGGAGQPTKGKGDLLKVPTKRELDKVTFCAAPSCTLGHADL